MQCPNQAIVTGAVLARTLWYMAGTSARLRELGAELRALREERGLGVRALALKAGMKTHAHISLWEKGARQPSEDALARVLDVLEASGDDRERLLGLLREAQGPGRFAAGMPGLGETVAKLIELESSARRITDWSLGLIPGLLQTSDYARAIMGDSPHAEARVILRAGRRDVLTRRDPVELVALIDSEVLVRPVAPRDVMIDQLRHLLDMGTRANVTIQVVSSTRGGWHPGLAGPFELIEFPKASPVVHLEHHRSSVFLWEGDDVREFVDAADEVKKVAMTPAESARAIAWIVNGQETT